MRTTLTIDEDVAAKLKDELKRSGGSFKELVNDVLRTGLGARQRLQKPRKFKVRARDLGFRPGLNYDNIGELLERCLNFCNPVINLVKVRVIVIMFRTN